MLLRFFWQQKQWARLLRGLTVAQHFAAVRAEEAEVAFAHFGRRPLAAQGGDGDGHGQVVAKAAQQIRRDHGFLRG